METIFMNTENSRTNESHRFKLNLTDKLNLKDPKKNMALANLNIYYTWKNIKSEFNDNKFKISAPTWNDTFNLPDGSYSFADIQDYFEFIIKKHETLTENITGVNLDITISNFYSWKKISSVRISCNCIITCIIINKNK